MIEHRCPDCRKLAFRAEAYVAVEWKCPRCGFLGAPRVTGPVQGAYECPGCGRQSFCEKPPADVDFCVPCGLEMRPVRTKAPARAPYERARAA